MRFDRRAVARELKSWFFGALIAVPVAVLFTFVVDHAVPSEWVWAIFVALAILPQITIQVLDGWALFAISLWAVPAVVVALVAFTVGSRVGLVALLAVGVTGWLLCMYEWAAAVQHRLARWITQGLVRMTLSPNDRVAYSSFLRAHRRAPALRRALRSNDGDAATVLRETASDVLQLTPPDAGWAEVFRATADVGVEYAEMLEGKRLLEVATITSRANARDAVLVGLLRARSWIYRLVTYAPVRRGRISEV